MNENRQTDISLKSIRILIELSRNELSHKEIANLYGSTAKGVAMVKSRYLSDFEGGKFDHLIELAKQRVDNTENNSGDTPKSESEFLILALHQQGVRGKSVAAVLNVHENFVYQTTSKYFNRYMEGEFDLPESVVTRSREILTDENLAFKSDRVVEAYLKGNTHTRNDNRESQQE